MHGWEQVAQTIERPASTRRDAEATSFEIVAKYVTPELAYVVEVERLKAKVRGGEITPYALRVTMVFRPEDGVRKVVHRHADQTPAARAAESVLQQWNYREPAAPPSPTHHDVSSRGLSRIEDADSWVSGNTPYRQLSEYGKD